MATPRKPAIGVNSTVVGDATRTSLPLTFDTDTIVIGSPFGSESLSVTARTTVEGSIAATSSSTAIGAASSTVIRTEADEVAVPSVIVYSKRSSPLNPGSGV